MAEADQTILQQTQTLLPEYQERFLKDLLANVYQTDPVTGQVSGIAAVSPLFGRPMTDEQGRPLFRRAPSAAGGMSYDQALSLSMQRDVKSPEIQAQIDAALAAGPGGEFTADPSQAQMDQFGQPIEAVEGGVPRPDIMRFTPAQQRALELGAQGIGLYEPMMERAEETLGTGIGAFQQGISGLGATTAAFDPQSYRQFYDPFVEDVIRSTEADIQRQADIERQRIGGAAVRAGAFGGSRQAVAEQELARNAAQQLADTSARLRSAAFTGAQQQAQSAFENQMARGQTAGQIFGQLGQGIGQLGVQQGALGEAAQGAAQRDVNALFNIGALEQAQRQAEFDVQRAGAIEEAFEPFQRFAFMSDIFRGVPSSSQTLAATSVPRPNPVASIFGTAQALSSMPGGMSGILGGLSRGSGA